MFSYNFPMKTLTFAFLGDMVLSSGEDADCFKTPLNGSISLSANTDGSVISDPVAAEMNSHDVFTECVVMASAKENAEGIGQLGATKVYNLNSDAAYLPLYPGADAALVD